MKHLKALTILLAVFCLCISITSDAKDAMVRNARKSGNSEASLDVDISFSSNAGETITDEDGTTFCFYGYRSWEEKIYPSEYWGVFPLYFFGQRVGITVDVKNESTSRDAKLRVTTECYCLKTDGGNGAQLLAPQETSLIVPAGTTATFDGSFVGEFVEDAESGLDRFLVKIYEAGDVTYQVVRDAANTIKYEDSAPGLGEDDAKQIDTFVIGIQNATPQVDCIVLPALPGTMPPMPEVPELLVVLVTTKAGPTSCTTRLEGVGATATDELGFKLFLHVTGLQDTAAIAIESVSNRHALSHVEFEFIEGAQVLSPDEGPYSIARETLMDEDSALIMVKEGIFCPPELDEEMTKTIDAILGN